MPHRHGLREPQRLPRLVQQDAIRKFFAVITDPRSGDISPHLRCGLRISEVATLRLTDLFLDETLCMIIHGKVSKDRTAYLSPQAEQAVTYLSGRAPHVHRDALFVGYRPGSLHYGHPSAFSFAYHTGQFSPHPPAHPRLRHTFANDLSNADVPVTTIRETAWPRLAETTQIYVAANDRQVQADYNAACAQIENWADTAPAGAHHGP
ncbi:tyrosine-type recombinase/integrase [Candidatus Amarolinea dominans]|uniref:tyrosine-type recombinase/integrase n=1 Tax=Candidatus Amarolinea dominans TaxID=3140696 RepID=UPI001DA0F9E3|nr:tyrosine-type recombinase/integrase [Anaerolineae bacterium]